MTETQPLTYDDAVRIAEADPAVVGLFLIGSNAMEGLTTDHSDHDLFIITAAGATTELQRHHGMRSPNVDLNVVPLDDLLNDVVPEYVRYAFARSRVVMDRTGGELTAFLEGKGRLDPQQAFEHADEVLDAYANSLYRSVKNHRDGRALAGRLDAADSVGYLLELLFTLECRPRPYNKCLEWELERHPLPGWDTAALLDTIGRIVATGDSDLQRGLFAEVEPKARKAGHDKILDEWGDDLHLMRPRA
ncbi:hypothetical protein O1R50_16015 [Glycomyces luteolus]|uniref:Nucleotidyltransferase domain-containing protein n=1 Tax=Glycomyces luteolus TaxID=2670330 RepID=A0A9X3SR13_9ACTN|nr:hypothetical protein [Glycomyces luteolus]MDA1361137.1 hypothetical protein [Glycomyces luteolus]